ncbi:MAG: DUF3604 domain-containing protein [Euryarchaeota archaeon]|nr:DUF3604 domain-containing protein [Euryarchaeota archaeon]
MNKKTITLISVVIITSILLSNMDINIKGEEIKDNSLSVRNNIAQFLDNSYSQLYCVMPSNAVVGQPIHITIQAWDWAERICKKPFSSSISFLSTDTTAILPSSYSFKIRDDGVKTFEDGAIFNTPGIHYVTVTDTVNRIWAVSNPIKVTEKESEYKWYWGDIHCHSANSDGTGTLNNDYKYARDTNMLDFCAYADHDVCSGIGRQTTWMKLAGWGKAKQAVEKFYDPGRFVTLLAYEYSHAAKVAIPGGGTVMLGDGHYNVYYNTVDDAPFFSSIDENSNRIFKLWSLLKEWKNKTGHDVFTVPHHPLSSHLTWDSTYYDPELVPLIEIFQYRGSSEMKNDRGNPVLFDGENNESGHSVQDGLAMGYKFGFISGSDDHSGHPGHIPYMQAYLTEPLSYIGPWRIVPRRVYDTLLPIYMGAFQKKLFIRNLLSPDWTLPDVQSPTGGSTGVMARELTRDEIFNALKDRRCVAVTNVNRMIIDFTIDGKGIGDGSEVNVSNTNSSRIINCSVAGTSPIKNVTIVKNNETFYFVNGIGSDPLNFTNYKLNFSIIDTEPITGIAWDEEHNTGGRDFYYIRVIQTNGGAGWIGPIWVNPLNKT